MQAATSTELAAKFGGTSSEPQPDVSVKLDFNAGYSQEQADAIRKSQAQQAASRALAAQFGGTSEAPAEPAAPRTKLDSAVDSAVDLGKSFAETANPVPVGLLKSIYEKGNVETLKGIAGAQGDQFDKAHAAFTAGNYLDAARYTAGWLIPLLGPAINSAGDELGRGEYAKGVGHTLGLGANIALPAVLSKVKGLNVGAALKSKLNPVEAAAIDFGDKNGIPIDAATRTGNGAIKGAQNILAKQPGSAGIAQAARQAQSNALTFTAENLRTQVEPGLGGNVYTPETAGAAVQTSLQNRVSRFNTKAGEAYTELRRIEADPANAQTVQTGTQQQAITQGNTHLGYQTVPITEDVALPVDMRPVKAALQPIFDRLKERMPLAQQQASAGLKALDNIINGKDIVSASTADGNLSSIKSIAREASSPELRTVSQGLAAKAVSELDTAVQAAVAKAGPDAIAALKRGRALTKAKYGAADLLSDLRNEPVQVFNQLTFRKDSSANLLRAVAKQAPQDLPKLGRAFLDGLLETATKEGGFYKAGTLQNSWVSLGKETKTLLFKNPMLIRDLDNFFLLAKKIAENPNPSGTASTAATLATGGLLVTNPLLGTTYLVGTHALARLLFSPKGSAALTTGFKISLGNKFGAAAAVSEILALAGRDAQLVPATAQ